MAVLVRTETIGTKLHQSKGPGSILSPGATEHEPS